MMEFINETFMTITDGKRINGDNIGKKIRLEEKRAEKMENVDNITIKSDFIDVNIILSETSKIEAELYGQITLDDDNSNVALKFKLIDRELTISVDFEGSSCYNSLKFDIAIPSKLFDKIYVETVSASVLAYGGIFTKLLEVNTVSGNFDFIDEFSADNILVITTIGDFNFIGTFVNAKVSSNSGTIKFGVDAKNDIKLDITTAIGDVVVKLNNIGKLKLFPKTRCGILKNNYDKLGKYTANIYITSVTGDIKIK